MFTGGITTGTANTASQIQASGTTNWADSFNSLLTGIGSIGSTIGTQYQSIDKAWSGQVPYQPQGSTENVTIQSGGQKSSNGSLSMLMIGGGIFLVGILGILAFKK